MWFFATKFRPVGVSEAALRGHAYLQLSKMADDIGFRESSMELSHSLVSVVNKSNFLLPTGTFALETAGPAWRACFSTSSNVSIGLMIPRRTGIDGRSQVEQSRHCVL